MLDLNRHFKGEVLMVPFERYNASDNIIAGNFSNLLNSSAGLRAHIHRFGE